MAHQIENTEVSKWLLFVAAIAAVIAATGRYVLQPIAAAWLFHTLKREKERVRGLIADVFEDEIKELARSAKEIRECQEEQGKQLARVEGYLTGRAE